MHKLCVSLRNGLMTTEFGVGGLGQLSGSWTLSCVRII